MLLASLRGAWERKKKLGCGHWQVLARRGFRTTCRLEVIGQRLSCWSTVRASVDAASRRNARAVSPPDGDRKRRDARFYGSDRLLVSNLLEFQFRPLRFVRRGENAEAVGEGGFWTVRSFPRAALRLPWAFELGPFGASRGFRPVARPCFGGQSGLSTHAVRSSVALNQRVPTASWAAKPGTTQLVGRRMVLSWVRTCWLPSK